MKIVLSGFMGTGKTSVGIELSRKLGYAFIDTDVLIEEREGMPISLIFKKKGEDYFRQIEQSIVAEVSRKSKVVIATGGGVIKNRTNVDNLGKGGILVWLKADAEIILKRVDTNYITPQETAQEIIEMLALDGQEVRVGLHERSYDILIGSRILDKLGLRLKEFRPSKIAVISNKTVYPIYRDILLKSLRKFNIVPEIIVIPDGEEYKDFLWTYYIHGELLKARFDRDSLLVALGGGVVGDITGFVASTYMRGIRYVQVPTTLLAQVDSSVGGKTGVNHPIGKNMIGTFCQPSLVLIDVDTLRTLPEREFYAGISEIIKYGIIADKSLFDYLKSNREGILSLGDSLMHVIKRSCEIKADVVSKDERESGLRAILNFGHTIGHSLETVTGYRKFLHGEAIAIGMCSATELSERLGIAGKGVASSIKELAELYNLPARIPQDVSTSDLVYAMGIDKKAKGGRLRFILPEKIGQVTIQEDIDRKVIAEAIEASMTG
jgi:3-dehydroquinate synthase